MRTFHRPHLRRLGALLALSAGLARASEAIVADQGQYVRRSISRVGGVWLPSAGSASPRHKDQLQGEIDKTLHLPRFDENAFPDAFLSDFHRAVEAEPAMDERKLGEILERTLAPKILEVVRSQAVVRAADLRSDLQKNSSVADKMKDLDITSDQFLAILNSAWIYVPVIKSLEIDRSRDLVTASVRVSVLWYHVEVDSSGDSVRVRLERTVEGSGTMAASPSPTMDLAGGAEAFAFRSATKSAMAELLRQTREIPEFSLSGQVIEAHGTSIRIDVGTKNGVRSGEKYRLLENRLTKDGSDELSDVGWFVAKNPSPEASEGSLVSGRPYAGLLIQEIPQMPLDMGFGLLVGPHQFEGTSTVSATATDLRLDFSNSWFSLGSDFLWGSFDDDGATIDVSEFGAHAGISLKPQVVRRLGLLFEAGIDYRWISLSGQAIDQASAFDDAAPSNSADGPFWYGRTGLTVALTPSLNLSAEVLAETPISDLSAAGYKVQHFVGFGATLHWTLPALGFDPMDAVASFASVVSQSNRR